MLVLGGKIVLTAFTCRSDPLEEVAIFLSSETNIRACSRSQERYFQVFVPFQTAALSRICCIDPYSR